MKTNRHVLLAISATLVLAADVHAGRWLSRDPIEEGAGFVRREPTAEMKFVASRKQNEPNLYAFVSNNSVNKIDALGLFLAAIDGTDSKEWLRLDPTTGRFNSHVRNFYETYSGPGGKQYWNGPNLLGGGVAGTVDEVYKKICEALRANPRDQINIVGHSRGGLIAILVANKLKDKPCLCGNNKVHFMGLYDAVDRYIGGSGATIPDNVEYVAHARRDPAVNSRPTFGNTGTSGGQVYEEQFFWVTHSGAGGDPWGGDHPTRTVVDAAGWGGATTHEEPTITKEQDEAGSIAVDAWIRNHFR